MSIVAHDRWLWLGLGCFTFFTIYTVYNSRSELLRLSEVHVEAKGKQDEPRHWEVNQETEDRVSADALFELAQSSTNSEIRKSATKILLERLLHNDEALASLKADARCAKDSSAYRNVCNLGALAHSFQDYELRYFIDSILNPRYDNNPTRPQTADELSQELRSLTNTQSLLRQTLIDMINARSEARAGRDQLQPRHDRSTTPLPGIRRAAPIGEVEQELRRRRREAIVLNEGDRPVTQDDIIQRRRTGISVSGWNGGEEIDAEIVDAIEQGLAMMARGEDATNFMPR